MAKPHGLSTLIEAARFIEVGESQLSLEKRTSDDVELASTSLTDNAEHDATKSAIGCLRHELQTADSSSSLSMRARSFHSTEEVRQDHNRMEKLRRRDMRKEFDDLKNRIPCLLKGKHSSVAVLQSAVEYIGELKELEKSLKSKHQMLFDQHKSLRQQLVTLQQGHAPFSCVEAVGNKDESIAKKEEHLEKDSSDSQKRKRSSSESSTISADSPKMFIGSRDEDFEVTEDDQFLALCKKQCNNSTVCLSPSLSVSSCLTVATSTPLISTSNNHASPSSETITSSAGESIGLMSPPESCASSVSRASNSSRLSPTTSDKVTETVETKERKCSAPKTTRVVAPVVKKAQPPASINFGGNSSSNSNPDPKKSLPPVAKVELPNAVSPPAFISPARPTGSVSNQSTPVGPAMRKPVVAIGKQLAATFANDRPQLASKRQMPAIPFVLNNAKVLRQTVSPDSVNLSEPSPPGRPVPQNNNKRPVPVTIEKRIVKPETTVNKNGDKTAAPVSPAAVPAPGNVPVSGSICVVAGSTATATVTPITIVTPVKPAQVVFLQPVNATKICQPVVLLPASAAAPATSRIAFSAATTANKPVAIVKYNNVQQQTQIVKKAVIRTGTGESQQILPVPLKRSPIIVLRPPPCPVATISPAISSPSVKQSTTKSYPVISMLSSPATPNGVIFTTSAGQQQKPNS